VPTLLTRPDPPQLGWGRTPITPDENSQSACPKEGKVIAPEQRRERAGRSVWTGGARIGTAGDIDRIMADVNTAGLARAGTAALAQAVEVAAHPGLVDPSIARALPVASELKALFAPWGNGLRRGATVAVSGSLSLVMALVQ
jgi:hypothetical protein